MIPQLRDALGAAILAMHRALEMILRAPVTSDVCTPVLTLLLLAQLLLPPLPLLLIPP